MWIMPTQQKLWKCGCRTPSLEDKFKNSCGNIRGNATKCVNESPVYNIEFFQPGTRQLKQKLQILLELVTSTYFTPPIHDLCIISKNIQKCIIHPAASNYLYHPSGYISTTAGLLPITHSHLNPHAAALNAASHQAYFDYTNATAAAAAAYPGTYQTAATAATGMEPYAAAAVSAASAMSPYAAVPGYTWPLPQAATAAAAAAAAGTIPLSTYPAAAQPQLQEARMQ
ncbi:hypothetical protein SK128_018204 [Halocaridina rubra]|uniref:Uncharacterized protein n=1 Tax=Halocaridina rubra TaxID=373956 RepID=A0AAN9AEJ5_HALRR